MIRLQYEKGIYKHFITLLYCHMQFTGEKVYNSDQELDIIWMLFTAVDGPIYWLEGGYKFKTGIIINGKIINGNNGMDNMDGGAFEDLRHLK